MVDVIIHLATAAEATKLLDGLAESMPDSTGSRYNPGMGITKKQFVIARFEEYVAAKTKEGHALLNSESFDGSYQDLDFTIEVP